MLPPLPHWVVDTSILIDFHVGGILPELFRLPAVFVSTDILIEELHTPPARRVLEHGLIARDLTGEQLSEIIQLRRSHHHVSVHDLSAYMLARDMAVPLITGDRRLRELAMQNGITVYGTLWLLDALINANELIALRAADALDGMLAHGSRLPQVECTRRLTLWCAV